MEVSRKLLRLKELRRCPNKSSTIILIFRNFWKKEFGGNCYTYFMGPKPMGTGHEETGIRALNITRSPKPLEGTDPFNSSRCSENTLAREIICHRYNRWRIQNDCPGPTPYRVSNKDWAHVVWSIWIIRKNSYKSFEGYALITRAVTNHSRDLQWLRKLLRFTHDDQWVKSLIPLSVTLGSRILGSITILGAR